MIRGRATGSLTVVALLLLVAVPRVPRRPTKVLLIISAGSLATAMVFAGVYAVGDWTERYWLLIPQMVRLHGIANALGFTLCALLAWTLESRPRSGAAGGKL